MTWVVVALVFIDVAALSVGLSIRHKVTRIVEQTAAEIEGAVKEGISDAVARFAMLAKAVLAGRETPLLEHADELIEALKR